jgi:polyhydroxyalkanoate synthesis regulator phasin
MKDTSLKRVSDDMIRSFELTAADIQECLDSLAHDRAIAVSRKSKQLVNDHEDENAYVVNRKEAKHLTETISKLEFMVQDMTEENPKRKEYSHELYTLSRDLEKVHKSLEKMKLFHYLKDIVDFTEKEERIETYDALAERVGKWFEAGNAGSGTVTYNGKTYTYQGT